MNKLKHIFALAMMAGVVLVSSCGDDDPEPSLSIPSTYVSVNFAANTTAETAVIDELATMTSAANDAEANAQGGSTIAAIPYPSTLSSVTLPSYRALIEDWLVELVASANSSTGFQTPGAMGPAAGEEGGLLGSRLLDENGLELEQMVQKGSFGAALYNHALTVIDGDLSDAGAIDKLVKIIGTDVDFTPGNTTAAATYARRRSNQTTQTGTFYDIRTNLITAKAAIEAGDAFTVERDRALADFLLNWEKSNFATVIYYCNATKDLLQTPNADDEVLGDAMHAYAEGVAFAHGFRGLSNKTITDAQIDQILNLLLAPAGQTPTSYRFLNDATLIQNLDDVVDLIQDIYNFTDAEINTFFVNDPS